MRRLACLWLASSLIAVGGPARPLHAAPVSERAADVPLAVEGPELQDRSAGPGDRSGGSGDRSGEAGPGSAGSEDRSAGFQDRSREAGPEDRSAGFQDRSSTPRSAAGGMPAAPRVPAPTAAIKDGGPELVTVAVGLGPSAPGSKAETAVVDALERAARASQTPPTLVRRLRAGAGEGRAICRERRDDLVLLLEYMPDRAEPVLVPRDCRLDRELALRGQEAAGEPALIGVLWDEHRALVRGGARERKVRISRKVKTGLIAGGAIVVVGLAIVLVVVNSLRRETVVLTVGP